MNVATDAMQKMTKMFRAIDKKYKEFATEPYRQRQMTPKEQREFYENLTEAQLYELIQKHGIESVSQWLYRMEQGGNNG